jgi:hypothetical protein
MTDSEASPDAAGTGDESELVPQSQSRQAAAIYGLIVTAAVMASAGGQLGTLPLAFAVVVTLIVYWLAEEYAWLIAHAHAGERPSWVHIRSGLSVKWPMVTSSYVPLVVLVIVRLFGASAVAAAFVALGVTVALLGFHGWSAARAAGMRGLALFLMTSLAGALGVLMVALKIVITHLH